jgi:hypothetical protein
MISKDIEVVDLGSDNWSRVLRLPAQVSAARPAEGAPKRRLLVVFRGLKVLKAVDLGEMQPVDIEWAGTSRLDTLAARTGYDTIVALEETAVARVIAHAQREIDYADDLAKQWLCYLDGASKEWGRTIFVHPEGLKKLPAISSSVLGAAVSALIPDDTLVLLAVTERWHVWASIVLGYRDSDFWLLTSLDTVNMEGADLRDGNLPLAADRLAELYGGTVRAIVIEKSLLMKASASRYPALEVLWGINSGQVLSLNLSRRFKAALLGGGLLSFFKR